LVTTVPLPDADLGPDTAFCFGDVFTKTLNPGTFNSYQWSTGDTTQTIVIGAFDSAYAVTVTDSTGCVNSDNISVSENSLPNPDLGADTSYCEGVTFAVALSPGGFQQYQWSDGSTGPILLVTQGGNYEVTVTDVNGCVNTDDLLVTELPKPTVNLGPDVTLCEDSAFSFTLDASAALPPVGYSYSWNTLENTPAILINSFGSYAVTVEDNNNNCLDSSRVDYVPFSLVQPNLGADTRICEGEVINLEPEVNVESGYSFTWSTGASTRSINVNQDGTYWVELNAINGTCVGIRDTIVLSLGLLPVVELGPDINACLGQTVVLLNQETSIPGVEYRWQDTIPTTSLPVMKTGTYRVKVTNECGTVSDEVDVLFEDCYQVYVPSAFTPNGDGMNDAFFAETDQELLEFNLIIYDRWGRTVFKTNDVRAQWDGTVNGEFAQDGIYVWKLMYIRAFDPNGFRVERTGHLTLSR
jgi:gliding motility-associated-like protein